MKLVPVVAEGRKALEAVNDVSRGKGELPQLVFSVLRLCETRYRVTIGMQGHWCWTNEQHA